ncbi:solute carrier family 35 member C2-like [Condylostylus longicornis]|uniref:solute carrier family 35 member C2-like n=1 Tax=Condylostylus longicornis TaxID=2530218 RepID=UPI00244E5978|nr:solute carrier family 35 member C2-like [Condylostylus longicornis]
MAFEISYKQLNVPLSAEVLDIHETNENTRFLKSNIFVKPMSVFKIFSFIILYLGLSICLTFYQKWILKAVKYPLTIVVIHLILKFFLAAFVRLVSQKIYSRTLPNIDVLTSVRTIGPTGIASGMDIGFSNWGLELVTVSLYTMTKSSAIIFILIFAILLKLEKLAVSLVFIVCMIASGLFMFTYKSTSFDAFGFVFLLIASMASGLRRSFAQMIMQTSKFGLCNPIDMMFYMQPWMFFSLLPFMLGFEGPKLWNAFATIDGQDFYYVLIKITLGGVVAFIMEISEYLVLSHTSSLTLSITGIFKEICQLILAVQLNGDILNAFSNI